jgi:hypothetical protein
VAVALDAGFLEPVGHALCRRLSIRAPGRKPHRAADLR